MELARTCVNSVLQKCGTEHSFRIMQPGPWVAKETWQNLILGCSFLCEPTTWMVPMVWFLHSRWNSYWCSLGIDHQLIKGASGQVCWCLCSSWPTCVDVHRVSTANTQGPISTWKAKSEKTRRSEKNRLCVCLETSSKPMVFVAQRWSHFHS